MAKELIRGTYKLKDKLLLILDTEKVTNIDGVLDRTNHKGEIQ